MSEAATGAQRGIKRMRIIRAVAALAVALNAFIFAVDLSTGSPLVFLPPACIVALLVLIVMQTHLIRTMRRTQELNRHADQLELTPPPVLDLPVTGMTTTADFELGIARLSATIGPCAHPDAEPVDLLLTGERVAWVCPDCNAELPADWKLTAQAPPPPVSAACKCPDVPATRPWRVHVPGSAIPVATYCAACGRGTGTITSAGSVPLSGTAALSGTGTLSAKATWDDVAYASEASQHFAQLARVGRNYCPSYCPICAERLDALMRASILAPKPDLGDVRGDLKRDMRDLSDLDGVRARRWPSVTSDLAPVGAYDFHFDSAGREWCRDADDLCWIKPVPDGPWYRQNKPEGGEQ